ncbi:MAG: ParA family protein [Pseudonocardiaceae bacterium]
MTPPIITFFNNKGGVGKTSLVYHLAWMFADLGYRVVAADLDPQANLTAAFLDEDEIEQLWDSAEPRTMWSAIRPFVDEEGAIRPVTPTLTSDEQLVLLPGDLSLSRFEDELSSQWRECLEGTRLRPFLVTAAFWTVLRSAAEEHRAHVVLVDVGPSLGAINRAALVASDQVVVPVAPDLFSLQGLRNLGPTLQKWRNGWRKRLGELGDSGRPLPAGNMAPLGYIVLGHGVRLDRPVQAYQRWIAQIPDEFHGAVLGETAAPPAPDPYCLAQLKHYHSLMPLAQEARKPMFALKPADGAFGGHARAAQRAYDDFRSLAIDIRDASRRSRTSATASEGT